MKSDLSIIREMIDAYEEYSQSKSAAEINLRNFIRWMYEKTVLAKGAKSEGADDTHLSGEIVFLMDALTKRFKSSVRSALADSQIKTSDEFSFVIHLAYGGSFRKLELIKMHFLEVPSGIEIIKRLLGRQLIAEYPDPDDARAKRLKLTDKGKKELGAVQDKMMGIYTGMTGEMLPDEKMQLKILLRALLDFHVMG